IFVLAGAIASNQRTRLYDGVVMKVLGATRAYIVATYLLEYALLGLGMACLAALFGALTAYLFVTQIMDMNWFARLDILGAMVLGTSFIVIVLALFGTWRALGDKSVPILRNH
ncbi:MAG: ABC transporter permease, partial [Alphaproteobacteria bacterium]|nr:ABC transporter permease [Alphaproteobacteria bacterium]